MFAKHNHTMRLRDFIISAILATISATICLAGDYVKEVYDKDVVVCEGSVGSTKAKDKDALKGASNGGYHYFGSAKILSQVGKAFAEAILKLQK